MTYLPPLLPVDYPEMRQAMGNVLYKNVMFSAGADIVNQFAYSIWDMTSRTAKTVQAFVRILRTGWENLDTELIDAHRQIAEQARTAIVESYLDSLLGTPTYRTDPIHERNKRYAGGALERVLSESDFCTYDARGVYIGNVEKLNAVARQWMRLNYGAGGAAGGGPAMIHAHWSNIDITLEEPGAARPAFMIPGGRWIGEEFYPHSELAAVDAPWQQSHMPEARRVIEGGSRSSPTMTRGIRGQHWIAAGLRAVADNIGPQYAAIFKRLWNEADEEGRRQLAAETGLRRPGTPGGYSTQHGGFPGRYSAAPKPAE